MSFECTGCGLCCTRIGTVVKTVYPWDWMNQLVAAFPYKSRPDGACEMLDDDGKCMVYENRPLLCDIERTADEVDIGMSKETWFQMNYRGCAILQQRAA